MSIITISRMYGSGGSEVAQLVAEDLGWALLDNAVVDAVAEKIGATPAEVASREERLPSLVERLSSALALSSQEWLSPMADAKLPPSDERLVEVTRRVVEEAVARGPLVVVGRGAQSMLAARSDALHVFCYAPRPALIARSAQRDKISPEEAAKLVDATNKHREEWVRKHWARSWRTHENYHMSLDTEWFGIQGAADVVAQVARRKFALALGPT
ncbi:MAG TPA: cytidylate kinase-like family protein [Gemmatimonadaceae bacterium]|nr:cytidylate kinase-like family protein [Gemmatimonadaceae bacterium]